MLPLLKSTGKVRICVGLIKLNKNVKGDICPPLCQQFFAHVGSELILQHPGCSQYILAKLLWVKKAFVSEENTGGCRITKDLYGQYYGRDDCGLRKK